MPGVSTSPSRGGLGPASVLVGLELPVLAPPLAASASGVEPDVIGAPDEGALPVETPAEPPAPDPPAPAVDPACALPPVEAPAAELPAAEPPPLETAPDVPAFPQAHNRSATAEDARRFRAIAEVGDRVTPTVRE
jgi:2-oxoglutarate dehydrogenase E2 component (dihydrolipoamide succinyltransferase)